MASDLTTFDFALKEYYSESHIQDLVCKDRPLLARLTKDTDFVGKVAPLPVKYGNGQGLGVTLAKAQSSASNAVGQDFNVTVGDYHGVIEIGDKVMKASRNNMGAFAENKGEEIDGLIEGMLDQIAFAIYASGSGGSRGIRASASTNAITLTRAEDAVHFEVGMTVSAADGPDSTDTERSGTTTVTAVDYVNGIVTLASAAAITSFADGDHLFRDGDFNLSSNLFYGLGSWIHETGTSVPALYGVTRSASSRLYGQRLLAAEVVGVSIEERLKRLCNRIYRITGKPVDSIYVNPTQWMRLSNALESRRQGSTMTEKIGSFGFEALQLMTSHGVVKVFADRFCPLDIAYALRMDSCKLWSMDAVPHFVNGDGLQMLRKSGSNDYEVRIVAYPAFVLTRQDCHGRTPLAA